MASLSRDHIVWAYRLLLDREPESEQVIGPKMAGYDSAKGLRDDIMTSAEFREKNRDYAQMNDRNLVIKPLRSGVRIFVDLADHAISLNIVRGTFEAAELAFACRQVRAGDCAIDAGAHIGLYSLHLAQAVGPAGRVYTFEPFAPNAELLESSVAENQFAGRISVARAAVGAQAGHADLVYAEHTLNSGGAFVVATGRTGLSDHARISVPVVELASVAPDRRLAFLKLDVEGAEALAVAGAGPLLARDRPVILCEIHHEQLARVSEASAQDLFDALGRFGYRSHALTSDGELGPALAGPPTTAVSTVAFVAAG